MNYPLKLKHWVGRELLCYFLGHKWKYSGSRKTKFYGLDYDEVPYSIRKRSGNHMFETVGWWSHKCVRCRLKERTGDMVYDPWYKETYRGINSGLSSMGIMWRCWFGKDNSSGKRGPFWKRILLIVPVMLAFGFEQFYVHIYLDHRIPGFPLDIAGEIVNFCHEWTETE